MNAIKVISIKKMNKLVSPFLSFLGVYFILSSLVFSEMDTVHSFKGKLPKVKKKHSYLNYSYTLENEKFYIYVPKNYDGTKPFGILAFINSDDNMKIPASWKNVIKEKQLLFIAPQRVGNNHDIDHRMSLTVVGVYKMMEMFKVNRDRLYIAGLSGGGRTASTLAFLHSDLFSGAIPICGANFYKKVKQTYSTTNGAYAYDIPKPTHSNRAKRNVKFVLITGKSDWRHGDILDVYHNGYAKKRFNAKLIDVPGMGHGLCDGKILRQALNFIDKL